jgi:homoserine O-acetyltransferase
VVIFFFRDLLSKIPNLKIFTWDDEFRLESGKSLPGFQLAYETYGELNTSGSNAIIIFHALSGSSHVYQDNSEVGGWWEQNISLYAQTY